MQKNFMSTLLPAMVCATTLVACGGATNSTSSTSALSGLAATGAGIANATVSAKCVSGAPLTGTTDANGSYNLVLADRTLPCMVQVTGGNPSVTLYSFAQAAGRVNITPVTDLIVARALGSDPAAAFTSYSSAQGSTIETGLSAAKTYVATQIAGITGSSIADPLTGAFSVGDADDKVLDALGNALTHSGKNVSDLRSAAQTGATLSTTVPPFLAEPRNLSATAASSSAIALSWSAVPGATQYSIYRASGTGVVASGTPLGSSTTTSYSDAGLSAATAYHYKVVPSNTVVTAGTASAEVSATTDAANNSMTVSGFSPSSGAVGDTVTISGTGFDSDPFHMQVKFSNNVSASVVSSTATSVVVTVPAGAVTGAITVVNGITTASVTSSGSFSVTGGGAGGGNSGTWTSRASPSNYLQYAVAYGNGTFVTVGYNRSIMTSTDGIAWTSRTAADSNYYQNNAVVWTGSEFVMGGDMATPVASTPPLVATSTDGITWTRRAWTTWNANSGFAAVTAVGQGAGKTMVGTNNGMLAYSTDGGATWTLETQSVVSEFKGFAGNATTRVAVGRDSGYYGVILVDTGSGWTTVTGLSNFVPRSVVWTGTHFLAVGGASSGLSSAVVATSTDGVSWTRRALTSSEIDANRPLNAAVVKGNTWYATADNFQSTHVIIASTDQGVTWAKVHEATVQGNASLAGIAASADRIVTVGGVKSVTLP